MGWVPRLRTTRLAWILIHVGLVLFSSTSIAGQASEFAFAFYRSMLGRPAGAHLHMLAEKGVHFVLFFSLGVILYYSLEGTKLEKITWVLAACLLVGSASETLQFWYPGRHPSLADVMLNGGSGLLGAILLSVGSGAAKAET